MAEVGERTTDADRPRRTLRPVPSHDWQEYLDGEVRCSACGRRRRSMGLHMPPCKGAGKVTVDVE